MYMYTKLCDKSLVLCCPGLPLVNFLSWKRLYIDDLALKKNWWRGRHVVRTLIGHSRK